MRWLVTGGAGQVGRCTLSVIQLWDGTAEVWSPAHRDLDVGDSHSLLSALNAFLPDVIINCAAWTAVDKAEDNLRDVVRVNVRAPQVMARWLRTFPEVALVHLSTDYVFGGGKAPYREDAPGSPLNTYGSTKWAGECAIRRRKPSRFAVVRTSSVFGGNGRNFVDSIVRQVHAGDEVRVVNDQLCQPTSAKDLSLRLVEIAARLASENIVGGTFHVTNGGLATWYDLATEVVRNLNLDPNLVRPIGTSDFPTRARRPSNAILLDTRLTTVGIQPLRDWRHALAESMSTGQ